MKELENGALGLLPVPTIYNILQLELRF